MEGEKNILKRFIKDLKKRYKVYIVSFLTLIMGLYLANVAGDFVEKFAYECPLNDTVHNILPLVDANFLASLLPILFTTITAIYILIFETENFLYLLFLIGAFNFIRALFLMATQLPPPYPRIDDYPYINIPGWYFGIRDLFPSGHTGFSFLLFLMIKKNKVYKIIALIITLLIITGILLMRVHYTIDIMGAIFIVYAIYAFSEKYLKNFFVKT